MGKAALRAQLSELSSQFSTVTAKIAELESALATLSSVSTEITYVLGGYESIKESYHLSGTPYENETTNEEKILTDTSSTYETHKSDIISKLNAKISELKSEAAGLRFSMNTLSQEIAVTKED